MSTFDEEWAEKYARLPEHVKTLLEAAKAQEVAETAARPPWDFVLRHWAHEPWRSRSTMPHAVAERILERYVLLRESELRLAWRPSYVFSGGAWVLRDRDKEIVLHYEEGLRLFE